MIVLVTVGLRGDRVDGARLRGRGDGVADDVERRRFAPKVRRHRVRTRACLFTARISSGPEQPNVKLSRPAVETSR